jgi:AcrR family transcriptional regulator
MRAESQRALKTAARRVFERDGFLNARISDISAESGLAHGSFYHYYKSKDEIFADIAREVQADMAGRVPTAPDAVTAAPDSGSPALAPAPVPDRVPPTREEVTQQIESTNAQYMRSYERNARMMLLIEQVASYNDAIHELRKARQEAFVGRAEHMIAGLQAQGVASNTIDARQTAFALCAMVSRVAYLCFVLHEDYDLDGVTTTLTQIWTSAIGLDQPVPASEPE